MRVVPLTQDCNEWHQFRRKNITGTEMSSVLNPKCWPRLLRDKLNPPKFKSRAMERGNRLEPVARKALQEKIGIVFQPAVVADDQLRAMASLDGLAAFRVATCEIKCPEKGVNSELWKKAVQGKLPKQYLMQVQGGLMLSGAPVCYFWVYDADRNVGHLTEIYPDPAIHDQLRESIKAYWDWVESENNTVADKNKDTADVCKIDISKAETAYIELLARKKFVESQLESLERQIKMRRDIKSEKTEGAVFDIVQTANAGSINYKKAVKENLPDLDLEKFRSVPKSDYKVSIKLNETGQKLLKEKIERIHEVSKQRNYQAA